MIDGGLCLVWRYYSIERYNSTLTAAEVKSVFVTILYENDTVGELQNFWIEGMVWKILALKLT